MLSEVREIGGLCEKYENEPRDLKDTAHLASIGHLLQNFIVFGMDVSGKIILLKESSKESLTESFTQKKI